MTNLEVITGIVGGTACGFLIVSKLSGFTKRIFQVLLWILIILWIGWWLNNVRF